MNGGPRGPRDNFFCWKFRVWYSLEDCVYRHGWQTHPECANCDQGSANLRLFGRIPPPPRWAELARAPQDGEAEDRPPEPAAAGGGTR